MIVLQFCTFIVLVVVLWVAVFRYKRRRLYKLAASFASPDSELPIIGVTHTVCGSSKKIMTSLQSLCYEAMENNGIIKSWFNHRLYLLLLNPEDIEFVLKHNLEKDDLHQVLRDVIGNGGIFAPVPIWRPRRKILAATFKARILDKFVEVFSKQSETLAKRLNEYKDYGVFDAWPLISAYTLDSVCETAMGIKLHAQRNPDTNFLTSLNFILDITCQRIFHMWLRPLWLFKLLPCYTEYRESVSKVYELTDEIIQKKLKEIRMTKNNVANADKNNDIHYYKRESFLDLLIEISGGEKGYTEIELREELLTVIVAGTDTSATILGYIILLLSKYPKIQEKVYLEIKDVFCESDRPIVKDDLQKLKYLEMVIKESLRLFPPVPFIIRKNEVEVKLPSGKILPADCGVVVSIWGVHRNPKYWGPDVEHFNPDRFHSERLKLKHPCSYIPFSSGPRNCLGSVYAMLSIKTVIASILRKYKIVGSEESSPIPQIPCKLEIMMKSVDGYKIMLQNRK